MKQKYYLFIRDKKNGVWWIRDASTNKRESLGTTDKAAARKLGDARYEHSKDTEFAASMALTFLRKANPENVSRTWANVVDSKIGTVTGSTQARWQRFKKCKQLLPILNQVVVETQPDDFLKILSTAKVSTIKYLMELHNFALKAGYRMIPVLHEDLWPEIKYGKTRPITLEEHEKILAREPNEERKKYYQLCWHLGWSQSDVAKVVASDIDWKTKTICKDRMKTDVIAGQKISSTLEALLRSLPSSGHLFPYLANVRESDRATEFRQRCESVGIVDKELKLHSYRYGLAQRLADMGYPERYAMDILGHNSKAVHRAYARRKYLEIPSPDEWVNQSPEVEALKAQVATMQKQIDALQRIGSTPDFR